MSSWLLQMDAPNNGSFLDELQCLPVDSNL